LEPLSDEDMHRSVTIRGEAHSVMQTANRQVAHYSYQLRADCVSGKHLRNSEWKSPSIPRGRLVELNRRVAAGEAS
jgi:hypothetical protein